MSINIQGRHPHFSEWNWPSSGVYGVQVQGSDAMRKTDETELARPRNWLQLSFQPRPGYTSVFSMPMMPMPTLDLLPLSSTVMSSHHQLPFHTNTDVDN